MPQRDDAGLKVQKGAICPLALLAPYEQGERLVDAGGKGGSSHRDIQHGFDKDLRSKTRRSLGWMFGETIVEQLFSLLIFILMARVLPKDELGTFAITFVMMDMGREVTRAGVFQQIARLKTLLPLVLDTIFWINVILGGAFGFLMVMLAREGQAFFHAPKLEPVVQAMAAALFISSLGNTHMALRLREFGHRTMAFRSLVAGIAGVAIATGGILVGFGIWAFVAQRMAREVIVTIFAWNSVTWRPRFAFGWNEARDDLNFGWQIVSAQLVGYLSLRVQDLIIARVLGPIKLGSYRVAWRSAELLGPQLISVFSLVSLQTLSRLQDDREGLKAAYCELLRNCGLLTIPALAGYGAVGPWLVPVVFGQQWDDAGRLAPILAFLALPFAITYFFQSVMVATGHARLQQRIAVADLAMTTLVGLAAVRFGLTAIATTYVLRAYLWAPVQVYFIWKHTGIGFLDHLRSLAPSVAAAGLMVVVTLTMLIEFQSANPIVLAVVCLTGAFVYMVAIYFLLPSFAKKLVEALGRSAPRQID